jgi:uncharacterized protein (TIGR02757 family)
MLRRGDPEAVKASFDRLYESFNYPESSVDPVHLLPPYADPADREIAAFVAAGLAFGRVASVMASVRWVLGRLGPHPAAFVDRLAAADAGAFEAFVHRWIRGRDLIAMLLMLQGMRRASGSIERFFADGLREGAEDHGEALESFSTRALALPLGAAEPLKAIRPGVSYFFPRPSAGGACKRLNLFLRWMVRRDRVDPGGWSTVPASRLVVPLDTHVIRVGACLGLTRYRSPGWRMAADITRSLRRLDPHDPVRYDYALCHLGMMNACGHLLHGRDAGCPLKGLCRPRARRPRGSDPPSARPRSAR